MSSSKQSTTRSGPRVTIGLPVYNGERFIREAIESVLGQSYGDLELLISDNASTDGTEDICREYAAADQRVRYLRNERNLGAAPNYNRLVVEARGEYFKWAAHDDVCKPTFVETCLAVLEADPTVILCHPRTSIIDARGEVLQDCDEHFHVMAERPSERLLGCFLAGGWIFHPLFGLMRRRTLLSTPMIGNYNGADFVLLAWLALAGKCHEVPERLLQRREHETRCRNVSAEDMPKWWNTSNKGFLYFRHWRRLREYVRAINTTPMPTAERARSLMHIGRWARWGWPLLFADFVEAGRVLPRVLLGARKRATAP